MKTSLLLFIFLVSSFAIKAQLYFPPNNSSTWDTIVPSSLGWCQSKIDSLYEFLDTNNTKAFVLLKDGKIVLEQYFDGHDTSSNWYWASAGKTLTAFMVGIAQQEDFLNINDTTATYLGQGWTSCTPTQEDQITIWHQLTMTSGLNDGTRDANCTDDTCLQYLADAGTRWAYHNAPYTLLDQVIENAVGTTLNVYTTQKLKNITGMNGAYIQQDYNNVFYSTPRSMARFGLLVLNKGNWNGTPVLTDTNYFHQMVNTSQNINESYGYLWWLNGKDSFMIPQTQFIFPGSLAPDAPDDMISALGKNGQFINIIPSQNMVWIRMGDAPDNSLVPFTLNNDIWKRLNNLECDTVSTYGNNNLDKQEISVYPNPVDDFINLKGKHNLQLTYYEVTNSIGQIILKGKYQDPIDISKLTSGTYYLKVYNKIAFSTIKFVKG